MATYTQFADIGEVEAALWRLKKFGPKHVVWPALEDALKRLKADKYDVITEIR